MSTASRPTDNDVTMTSEIHPGRRSTSKFFLHIISSNFSDPITIHHHAPSITDKPTQSNPTPTQLTATASRGLLHRYRADCTAASSKRTYFLPGRGFTRKVHLLSPTTSLFHLKSKKS